MTIQSAISVRQSAGQVMLRGACNVISRSVQRAAEKGFDGSIRTAGRSSRHSSADECPCR